MDSRFTLRYENNEYVLDEQIPTIDDDSTQEEIEAHQKHYDDANKVSCIMPSSMIPELKKTFENTWAYEMNQQLKEMFQAKASKEHLDVVKSLMACKPKPGASIRAFVLGMKGYFDRLESLNIVFDDELSINIILSGLPADYNQFVLSYKMNGKETSIMELHSLLQTAEQGNKKIDVPSTSAAHVLTGLKESRRSNHGELNLVMGNRKITPVTRIGKYELMLKSGLLLAKAYIKTVECISHNGNVILNVGSSKELDKSKLWHSRLGGRVRKPPQFYYGFHNEENKISDSTLSELDEPVNYKEAMASPEAAKKLTEDVFMAVPKGFENAKYPKRVCKIQKAIYGLKQASHSWNLCFHEKVTQFGFSRSENESCIYVKVSGSGVLFLVLYVDDILLIGNDIPTLQSVKDWLGKYFAMKYLGDATYILGIKIYRDRMSRVLYASVVGSIMYAMTCTRPDVSFALSMVSRHQQIPSEGHWIAVKNILTYIRNTKDKFLVYGGEEELRVTGYYDASWQTDKDDSRSQFGWVFLLNGGANFIGDLGFVPTVQDPIEILCDNASVVALTKEPKDHKKSKHIERKYHCVRSKVEEGHVIVKHIRSEDNLAYPFTKALAKSKHDDHARSIGLKDNIKNMDSMLMQIRSTLEFLTQTLHVMVASSVCPTEDAYSSSKADVVTLTKVMAMEMATHNIRMNTIYCGIFKSEITEGLMQKKAGSPEWLNEKDQT
ncbi:retrotransposon protein, putative, ty1-copia subclass [Tanacetum coccineum]